MKVTIKKLDLGYIVYTESQTFDCDNFLEVVKTLEMLFEDQLPDIKINWPELPVIENPIYPLPLPQTDLGNACSKCGLRFDFGPIGYFCSNFPCPLGLGGTTCGEFK